jgi:hypothetical protein
MARITGYFFLLKAESSKGVTIDLYAGDNGYGYICNSIGWL